MKKTKFLLAAMALPMLFTACSQEELVENHGVQNGPDAEGFYANFTPALDGGVSSRASWEGARLSWDETDKISVYWLGANPTVNADIPAQYQFNSVFKTTDGNAFTSESMVFVGGNVAVYPANMSNYTGNGNIVLEVPAVQDVNTIKSIPYISNYLDIKSRTSQGDNNPGYNNGIDAPMKMAANVFNLTFELKNTAGLSAYGFAVESVELHATDAFAKKAMIYTDKREKYDASGSTLTHTDVDDPYYSSTQDYWTGSAWAKAATITKNLWVKADMTETSKVSKLTSTSITKNADGTYTAQFVVLPTNVTSIANAKIVINTTCGHVDIVTPTVSETVDVEDTWIVKGGAANEGNGATLEDCLAAVVADAPYAYTENVDAKFMGEKTGRVFPRSIVADMNKATLNNSAVYTSADIIRYVNIYNKMGKENTTDKAMNLILSSKSTSRTFAGLTKAALAAVDGENNYTLGINRKVNVTLSAGTASNGTAINAVEITDAGAVYDIKSMSTTSSAVELVLGAGNWTMDDVLDLNAKITNICNKGTLTVNGTTHPTLYYQMSLVETICNEGTLKIGGNNILQVPGNLKTVWGSTTEIADGQNLIFTDNISEGLNGTFNVNSANAFLTTATGKIVVNEGVINNWGTVAAEGNQESNGFYNKAASTKIGTTYYYGGIINVKGEQAITYVYNNENGTINMLTRTDEVMVASALQGDIIYPYTAADGATFKYTIDDRFTCVKFGSDVANLTLAEPMNPTAEDYDGSISFENISFIFTGTTTLKAAATKNFEINNLTVNSGANLRVTTGNKLTVNDLTNNGLITIGGYIYYKNNHIVGRQLSQGGAIKKYDGVSYAQELVQNAIANAVEGVAEVTLDRDIVLDAPLTFDAVSSRTESELTITLNLNGHSIINNTPVYGALEQEETVTAAAAIYVNNSNLHLIINGDDNTKVSVDAKAHFQSAVWVRNGKVTINGGNYFVGKDDENNGCTTIQGYAKEGAYSYITINDGVFSCDPQTANDFAYDQYACLNLTNGNKDNAKTYITVNGGEFYCFNPANNCSEGEGTNFVAKGKKVIVKSTGNEATGNFIVGSYTPGWYVVK